MRAEDILAAYSLNSLRTIARTRAINVTAMRRPDLIAVLAQHLFDPPAITAALARLTDGERALLTTIAAADGRLTRAALAQALLDRGVIDDLGTGRARESIDRIPAGTRRFDELCARLTAAGLLFSEPQTIGPTTDPLDLAPGEALFVPGPVLEVLRRQHDSLPASSPDWTASESAVAPQVAPVSGGRLIVQPSYAVLLLPPLDAPTMRRLQAVAETVRVAETAEFRLTQAAAYAAAQRGESIDAIAAFLEERSGAPLPQNVRYTLDAWARTFDQARFVRDAVVVEGPAELLDRLQTDPELAPLALRRLAPERLLLRDAGLVAQRIEAIDEAPRHIHYAAAASPRCRIDATGIVTLARDDLLAPIALRRLAEPLGDGRFRLVSDRVRAAAATMPDGVTGVLKQLRALAGDIPSSLVARLRLWSLPAGAVRLEQPLLLRLPDDVLQALRSDPELAPLLADEYRPDAVLVRVAPSDRERLQAALHARGLLPDESSSAA